MSAPAGGPVTRLLVANRGEIARRVFATARTMGIGCVAVHSDTDAHAAHVREADVAVGLPGAAPADTYLRVDLLLDAADRTGADAVHPGYGFLSEDPVFASAVIDAGLTWIGPPASAMAAMGSKVGAKALMAAAGVPTLPSIVVGDGDGDGDGVDPGDADALGWPLLVKASAGGGGRGMRTVAHPDDLEAAITSARREARAAFGDGTVFLERFVSDPRHIEIQVMADIAGTTVALFERECSIQRRHQKLIEECPSPAIGPDEREQLCATAVAAARAVGYVGAGTVEFVLDPATGRSFFLEMNTRLQVEHPVTEAVTGLDLVRLQVLVARGEPLPPEVASAVAAGPRGHAIEVRLTAEDAAAGWRPSIGRLRSFAIEAEGVRVDSGVVAGDEVPAHYDPLLAKVIAHAATRSEAAAVLASALSAARIHGVTTTRDLAVHILRHPAFAEGETDTGFIDRHGLDKLAAPLADADARRRHALVAALALQADRRSRAQVQPAAPSGWRNNPSEPQRCSFDLGDGVVDVTYRFDRTGRTLLEATVGGEELPTETATVVADSVVLVEEGVRRRYMVARDGAHVDIDGPDGASSLVVRPRFVTGVSRVSRGAAVAPLPGGVVRVEAVAGQLVEAGDVLVVLEAMKMEHAVQSGIAGTVREVSVAAGDQVTTGQVLAVVDGTDGADGADAADAADAEGDDRDGADRDGIGGEGEPR